MPIGFIELYCLVALLCFFLVGGDGRWKSPNSLGLGTMEQNLTIHLMCLSASCVFEFEQHHFGESQPFSQTDGDTLTGTFAFYGFYHTTNHLWLRQCFVCDSSRKYFGAKEWTQGLGNGIVAHCQLAQSLQSHYQMDSHVHTHRHSGAS